MKALIIVDMQNGFCHKNGQLFSPGGEAIIAPIVKRIEDRDADELILFTGDVHEDEEYSTFVESALPIHCNTPWDMSLVDELSCLRDSLSASKFFSKKVFASFDLAALLKEIDKVERLEQIEICGTVTSICVLSNALLLRSTFPKVPIVVDPSLCADLSKEGQQAALLCMKNCLIEIL